MYRFSLLVIGILLGSFCCVVAQTDTVLVNKAGHRVRRAKSVYVEVLGSSGFGLSINYDMRFKPGNKGWGFRVGSGQIVREGRFTSHSFPLIINKISTDKRVAFEQGGGLLLTYRRWYYDMPDNTVKHYHGFYSQVIVNMGVRVQPLKTGVIWRLYWSPSWKIGTPINTTNLLWFGTSLGIGFH
jgi:hypothetical protein